jgi:hypothetical protein
MSSFSCINQAFYNTEALHDSSGFLKCRLALCLPCIADLLVSVRTTDSVLLTMHLPLALDVTEDQSDYHFNHFVSLMATSWPPRVCKAAPFCERLCRHPSTEVARHDDSTLSAPSGSHGLAENGKDVVKSDLHVLKLEGQLL